MDKTRVVLCVIEEAESDRIFDAFNMKSALEDLAIVIAGNNEKLKEGDLYQRLVNDYTKYYMEVKKFWEPYLYRYKDKVTAGKELFLDFNSHEIYLQEV